jgi:threonine dehydrogenase-like Zn-dependent dehydrogenase
MRQAILTTGGFAIREVPEPKCEPGQVLVRTAGIGICEGDVFRYKEFRKHAGDGDEAWMGHEASGEVTAVGEGVEGFTPGDRVSVNGGQFAEAVAADAGFVGHVPEGVELTHALGEPVACCLHAARRFGIRLGDRVAVVGSGFMGLVCMQLARWSGAAEVCAMDLLDWRLDMARDLGADRTVNPSGQDPADLAEELGLFDIVIEAAGTQSSVDLTTPLVRHHGRLVLVGYHITNGGVRTVNMREWNFRAIDVIHGHVRNMREKREAMKAGLRLMAAGRLRIESLVTVYPLAEAGRAFEDLIARKEGLFKAVLVP